METININQPMPHCGTLDRRGERMWPVDGPCAVVTLAGLKNADGEQLPNSSVIHPTGPGRDPRSQEEIREDFAADGERMGITFQVDFFESIVEAHQARPEAQPIDVANGVIKGHQLSVKAAAQAKAWRQAVEASGRQVCDRCGGAGGHSGWPGYTCYGCGGRGSVNS